MSRDEAYALLTAMETQHMERIAAVIREELDRQIAWADAAVDRADAACRERDEAIALVHAKESWIEGAKIDIQSLEDEVERLARPNGLRLVTDLTLARNEFARLRKALVEIVNVLGPDEVLRGEGLVHEAADALRAAKEALR